MRLVVPTVAPRAASGDLAPRLPDLGGRVIGLFANVKLNAAELLDAVALELEARHEIQSLRGTYDAARVMEASEWGPIEDCDAVILANGD